MSLTAHSLVGRVTPWQNNGTNGRPECFTDHTRGRARASDHADVTHHDAIQPFSKFETQIVTIEVDVSQIESHS